LTNIFRDVLASIRHSLPQIGALKDKTAPGGQNHRSTTLSLLARLLGLAGRFSTCEAFEWSFVTDDFGVVGESLGQRQSTEGTS
jgi:hypothetical protein